VARDERSDDEYRAFIHERFTEVDSAKRPSGEEFAAFAQLLHYRRMDLSRPEHYAGLKQWIDDRGADTVVLYLATSPLPVPGDLRAARRRRPERPEGARGAGKAARPRPGQRAGDQPRGALGFAESQALRIDHYLGKPAVQNLMALRFGNALFEPLWRRESIANIQITLAESLGVGTRGDYYDAPAPCATWCRTTRCSC
jgi:glucose-6-phosphate 1-dehydrogenase